MDEYYVVSERVDNLLNGNVFSLDSSFLRKIHLYLFNDIIDNCGKYRETNLSKDEDIIYGNSVKYANYYNISSYLEYDIMDESKKDYSKFNEDEVIDNIVDFNIRLWLTHPFRDGNTRSISVFIRMYLKSMGYEVDNSLFLDYFEYYRNSLVIACHEDINKYGDDSYLKLFYKKILFDKNVKLNNICYKKLRK